MTIVKNKIEVAIKNGKINNVYYPHFIAYYNGGYAKFALDMKMTEGKLPPKETHEIMDWARKNYDLLEEKWLYMMSHTKVNQINLQ